MVPAIRSLYALWARLPALHRTLRAGAVSGGLGIAIVFLTATPFVAATRHALPDPARDARLAELGRQQEEQQAKEQRAAREREEAEFASLGPESPLERYLIYLHSDTYGARARLAVSHLKNRQADAIGLLRNGRLLDLWDLQELDLSPTADLCQAYSAALAAAAGKVSKTQSNYIGIAIDLEGQLGNIRWLTAHRCDLSQPLGLLASNVRAVADSSRMTGFADTLESLGRVK